MPLVISSQVNICTSDYFVKTMLGSSAANWQRVGANGCPLGRGGEALAIDVHDCSALRDVASSKR